jgi:hypothetical protein
MRVSWPVRTGHPESNERQRGIRETPRRARPMRGTTGPLKLKAVGTNRCRHLLTPGQASPWADFARVGGITSRSPSVPCVRAPHDTSIGI